MVVRHNISVAGYDYTRTRCFSFRSLHFPLLGSAVTLSLLSLSEEISERIREKITKKEVNAIAIINDINKDIKLEFLEALESKHAKYILWSEKDEEKNIELLNSA